MMAERKARVEKKYDSAVQTPKDVLIALRASKNIAVSLLMITNGFFM